MVITIVDTVEHYVGITNGSGRWYLWWSGFFGNMAMFTGVFVALRHWNCHETGCWRHGKKEIDGGIRVCDNHDPAQGHRGDTYEKHKAHLQHVKGIHEMEA